MVSPVVCGDCWAAAADAIKVSTAATGKIILRMKTSHEMLAKQMRRDVRPAPCLNPPVFRPEPANRAAASRRLGLPAWQYAPFRTGSSTRPQRKSWIIPFLSLCKRPGVCPCIGPWAEAVATICRRQTRRLPLASRRSAIVSNWFREQDKMVSPRAIKAVAGPVD